MTTAPLRPTTAAALRAAGLDPDAVAELARRTLIEDLGGVDGIDVTTTATVDADAVCTASLVAHAPGVVAGLPLAAAVFEMASGGALVWSPHVADGDAAETGDLLATVHGPTRPLLSAERSALNLLCRASGIATHTRAWVDAVSEHPVGILDTRKTTPGLRAIEKYAVRCGGGRNKRMGLFDVAMIKDNHKLAAGGITAAYKAVSSSTQLPIEVEVTSLAEAREAVDAGATFLLCDNMSTTLLRQVVDTVGSAAELEATGGLRLENAAQYAATGVNYLSVGALTHSSPIMDIALDL
ncbi:MAG TPA: carboxylating nicotinate-nucleotide diphosphorylase [Mycobacteriales bacterium]|nr:carboxylating nicotinate-nucleotide diphosphorylase [Mycobacteriales bacterium]